MAEPKTRPTGAEVTAFIDGVPDERRRAEAHQVRALAERITGSPAEMWGPSMVGFGAQPYTNTSGTTEWFVIGFSPRKAALTFYGIYNDNDPADPLLTTLGPHTTGKGCLYVKRLDAVDPAVLERMLQHAWDRRS